MNITVLAGGLSTERDVSLISGLMCAKSLAKKGHNVFLLDVFMGTETNPDDAFAGDNNFDSFAASINSSEPDLEKIKKIRGTSPDGFFGKNVLEICKRSDVVFMGLHGANGEDGKIQAAFDLLGIKYTGSDYAASANAMSKSITRQILIPNGINMAQGTTYTKETFTDSQADKWDLFPCVVKPSCGGSSIGVLIVDNKNDFISACNECFTYDDEIIIEEFVKGREFSVGVLDGKALPVIEIIPDGLYDYSNKYSGKTKEVCPAQVDADKAAQMQDTAQRVFRALNLSVYARVDCLMRESDGKIFCLEANTLPGMTPTSLLPQEAAQTGINHEELCELIINKSIERFSTSK
ncbi:MAG: D-alanine--D-alanine ligase [Oscillospiraceae bacterium]|nr:D-alanine--D-alanine ligase [Oscillospiraceae bacterium]